MGYHDNKGSIRFLSFGRQNNIHADYKAYGIHFRLLFWIDTGIVDVVNVTQQQKLQFDPIYVEKKLIARLRDKDYEPGESFINLKTKLNKFHGSTTNNNRLANSDSSICSVASLC